MFAGVSVQPTDEFSDLSEMLERAEESAERAAVTALSPEAVQARRRRRRRRRVITAAVVASIAALIGTYIPVTLLAPVGDATFTAAPFTVDTPGAVELQLPQVGASAISLAGAEEFDGATGILASSGGDAPRPIASITKVITTMVILDAKPVSPSDPGPTITFSEADADLYDEYYVKQASIWPMRAGSTMSLRDALEIMLVVSATNYADAVSRWAFGSRGEFLSAAEAWLDANGLTGTTIVEPTGLDPRNLSTPADLIAIGRLAMADPVVAELVSSPHLLAADGVGRPNTNSLLGVDGINGIKTGTLDAAGACLLFSASLDVGTPEPVTVVGVVLGGDNHYQVDNAVQALLASVRSGFHEVPLLAEGQELGTYTTVWGEQATVVAAADATVLTWSDMAVTSTLDIEPLALAADGTAVGQMTFSSGTATVAVPLVLDGAIEGPDEWWRLTHPGGLGG